MRGFGHYMLDIERWFKTCCATAQVNYMSEVNIVVYAGANVISIFKNLTKMLSKIKEARNTFRHK